MKEMTFIVIIKKRCQKIEVIITMNNRIISIIKDLCEIEKNITIEDLAQKYTVSQRTIRNDLSTINDMLKENELDEIELIAGGSIQRKQSFTNMNYFLTEQDLYSYKLSKEERIAVASVLLINSSKYITLSTIADNLFVSRATIINDLDEIKNYIHCFGLEVTSHPNKGLRVEGKESDKRLFLMRLANSKKENTMVSRHISIQAGNRITIQKVLSEQEHLHKSYLTDESFQKIILYLGIMVNRNLMGEYLEDCEMKNNDYYLMAQDILRYVSQYCHINTTENEIQFLSELLTDSQYMKQVAKENRIIKIQLITRQFIERISYDLGINLNDDYDFFENLSNHLESVLKPTPPDYPESSIIDEVLEENQDVLEAVNQNLSIIKQYVSRDIHKIEIGYIAVHICAALERKKNKEVAFHVIVACHAGIGTSQLLIEKLKKHFNFQIIDVISAHEAENVDPQNVDVIISTVPLLHCQVDYVIVSPLLNDEDYIRVGNKIDALRNSRHLPSRIGETELSAKGLLDQLNPIVYELAPKNHPELMKAIRKVVRDYFHQPVEADAEIFSPYLHHLLPATHIQLDVECETWQEAVRLSALPLLEYGYIEERYIDAMIHNIEENGPYVVLSEGFAVPHEGLEQGSVQVGMNLIRLKHPVNFGSEDFDPVEFVCCLSAIDHKMHLKAFFNLVNMLKHQEFKEALRVSQTPQEAAAIIEKYEYSLI